jgi:uncharacterized protein DUF3489
MNLPIRPRPIAVPLPFTIVSIIRLLLRHTGAIHVVTAVITAEGDPRMTTSTTENQESTETMATAKEPEAPKKAPAAPRRAHVASSKAKSGKKPTSAKKGAKGAKRAKAPNKAAGARQESKTEKVLDLLKRSGGASLKDIMKATDWQAHSVRGFLSVHKKMGLTITSSKGEDGERTYSISR